MAGGDFEVCNCEPRWFVAVFNYCDSSVDASEACMRAKMTVVRDAAIRGDGKILASFREIPTVVRPLAERFFRNPGRIGIDGVLGVGEAALKGFEKPVRLHDVRWQDHLCGSSPRWRNG
jgi:repressor of nif and glnA expression